MEIGGRHLPRIVRRHMMPKVCDDCWREFEAWRHQKLARERREADRITGPIAWEQRNAWMDEQYGRFDEVLLPMWLAEGLSAEVKYRASLFGGLQAVSSAITERREKRRARRTRYSGTSLGFRRMEARYAPSAMPLHAEIEAER